MRISFKSLLKHHHSHFCITRVEKLSSPRTSWPGAYQAEHTGRSDFSTAFRILILSYVLSQLIPNTKQVTGRMIKKILRKLWGGKAGRTQR